MDNLELLHKIAWSFHQTTHLDVDDLFQEAALAYLEALPKYDPSRGKITTYMWYAVTSHLRNYVTRELKKWNGNIVSLDEVKEKTFTTTPLFETLSREAQGIVRVVIHSPKTFDSITADRALQRIATEMIRRGWSWKKVWGGIRDLQLAFS